MKQKITSLALALLILALALPAGILASETGGTEAIQYMWYKKSGEPLLLDPAWFRSQLESMGYVCQEGEEAAPAIQTDAGLYTFAVPTEIAHDFTYYPAAEALAELRQFAETHGIPAQEGPWRIIEGRLYIQADVGLQMIEDMGYRNKDKDEKHLTIDENGGGYARNGMLYTRISFSSEELEGIRYYPARRVFDQMTEIPDIIGLPIQ